MKIQIEYPNGNKEFILNNPTEEEISEAVSEGASLSKVLFSGNLFSETSSPETSSPETSSPETSSPETSSPETSSPETSSPETQIVNTEVPQTGPRSAPIENNKGTGWFSGTSWG